MGPGLWCPGSWLVKTLCMRVWLLFLSLPVLQPSPVLDPTQEDLPQEDPPPGVGPTIGQVSSSPVGTPCLHTLSRECKSSCFGLGLRDWEKVLKLDCKSHAADYRFHFTLGVTFWAHINLGSMMDRMGNQPNVIKIPNSVP